LDGHGRAVVLGPDDHERAGFAQQLLLVPEPMINEGRVRDDQRAPGAAAARQFLLEKLVKGSSPEL
jgi:hypothetical protein